MHLKKTMGSFLAIATLLILQGCTSISEDDVSDYENDDYQSSSTYTASCYNEARAGCAYYYNMTSSEIGQIESGCASTNVWREDDNICDGNTQYNHHVDPTYGDYSYTSVCTNTYLGGDYKAYLYGLSAESAEYNRKACIENGGDPTTYQY